MHVFRKHKCCLSLGCVCCHEAAELGSGVLWSDPLVQTLQVRIPHSPSLHILLLEVILLLKHSSGASCLSCLSVISGLPGRRTALRDLCVIHICYVFFIQEHQCSSGVWNPSPQLQPRTQTAGMACLQLLGNEIFLLAFLRMLGAESLTLGLLPLSSIASSSTRYFEEVKGKAGKNLFCEPTWDEARFPGMDAFAVWLGFTLLLEDVSEKLLCFIDAFSFTVVGFVSCGSFIH